MSSVKEEYERLYESAARVDEAVLRIREGHPKFEELLPSKIKPDAIRFGNHLAEYIDRHEGEYVPEETWDLLRFISTLKTGAPVSSVEHSVTPGDSSLESALRAMAAAAPKEGASAGVTICKDPIAPGDTTFDEIAGQQDTKENIKRSYIYPYKYPDLFPTKSKGIMFYGPPGTGKTMLAKAATAQIPGSAFFAPTPGEMRGKYEGETEKNIAAVFECAAEIIGKPMPVQKDREGNVIPKSKGQKYKVAIIFIDEFDSLAGARGDDPGMRRSVNALLQGMDGISSSPNVSVIAATNRPWDIDEAVLRRFSAKVFIDLPNKWARKWLMKFQIATVYNSPLEKEQIKRILCKNESRTKENKIKIEKQKIVIREYDSSQKKFVEIWKPGIFDMIEKLGEELCTVRENYDEPTLFGLRAQTKTKDVIKLANEEFIDNIAAKSHDGGGMKMSQNAKEIIKKIKNNEEVDADEVSDDDKDYWFGYSGSDIDKIMDIAIQSAASRALNSAFYKIMIDKTSYYISTIPTYKSAKYTVTDDAAQILNDAFNLNLTPLNNDQAERALNYSLCEADIEEAMKKYPSTIKNRSYVDLLLFEYQGKVPKKKE